MPRPEPVFGPAVEAKSIGVRVGNWLSTQQAEKLLNAPDISTKKGLRDRAMLAVLLGCAARTSRELLRRVGFS